MIDGEAVILGVDGIADFNALHSRQHDEEVQLYAFDTLALDGEDLRGLPPSSKANLAQLLSGRPDGIFVAPFEQGKITLDEYLDRTVLYRPRTFTRDVFRDYMFSLSQPFPEVIAFARALRSSGRYFMGTINNESRELNNYRIDKFGFREIFRLFISSCFVGLRKPE